MNAKFRRSAGLGLLGVLCAVGSSVRPGMWRPPAQPSVAEDAGVEDTFKHALRKPWDGAGLVGTRRSLRGRLWAADRGIGRRRMVGPLIQPRGGRQTRRRQGCGGWPLAGRLHDAGRPGLIGARDHVIGNAATGAAGISMSPMATNAPDRSSDRPGECVQAKAEFGKPMPTRSSSRNRAFTQDTASRAYRETGKASNYPR